MKTIAYQTDKWIDHDLLDLVAKDEVLIKTDDGKAYLFVEIDAFEEEVMRLSQDKKFIAFLKERSKKRGRHSIEDVKKRLGIE